MNKISFQIFPSPDSNDHETRILIDGEDFLGADYLGLDPPSFFQQDNYDKQGELMIGRCTCGCEGCGDYAIDVVVNEDTICWTNPIGLNLTFDKREYQQSFEAARNDHSWEDEKRRTERLVTEVLKGSVIKSNYRFDWASARQNNNNQITLSYSNNGQQQLYYLPWDGKSEVKAVENAKRFLKQISN